jgi:hypothetical protein
LKGNLRSSVGQDDLQNSPVKAEVFAAGGHVVNTRQSGNDSHSQQPAHQDAELAVLIAAWPDLPKPNQVGIIAMMTAESQREAI